jgi:hypothetical protein
LEAIQYRILPVLDAIVGSVSQQCRLFTGVYWYLRADHTTANAA